MSPQPLGAQDCDVWEGRSINEAHTREQAEDGKVDAQVLLGVAFFNGCAGLPQDDEEAAYWFRRAAEQGASSAQFRLGLMARLGRGMPEDPSESARWWKLAAEQSHRQAQERLAAAYALGSGVPEDLILAHMWASQAAVLGSERARDLLNTMESMMAPEQIEAAQILARERQALTGRR
jgi:TPR repeat protein